VAVVGVTHDPLVTEYADRVVELVDGHLRFLDGDEASASGTTAGVSGVVGRGEERGRGRDGGP
jgi:ABC-type lipoprotein export system ATPase subunit